MAEFQELIKSFDRIRDYMRQFYVYGFKARNDFQAKSPRTYDNERRRIESWLSGYTRSVHTAKGKHVYINVDIKTISQNPLYAAWKSKSFTDNDLMLHVFILNQLHLVPEGMTASALCDSISGTYGVVFDSQTVRLKLKEYESLGILSSEKCGKNLLYRLVPLLPIEESKGEDTSHDSLWSHLMSAVEFFQGTAPFGFVGGTILDREDRANSLFQFKHQFIVHTLEDGILASALEAIHRQCFISYENKSNRSVNVTTQVCVPLKIFVSTQTGRRYLCHYLPKLRRFGNARLDSIQKLQILEPYEAYEKVMHGLEQNMDRCWGVSFGGGGSRLEEISVKLYIDEEKEPHILNRLYREGRGGQVTKIQEHQYVYSGAFFDTNEMLSWVKTFTGRVMEIQGTNSFSIAKVTHDWEKMYHLYCADDSPEESNSSMPNQSKKIRTGEPDGTI